MRLRAPPGRHSDLEAMNSILEPPYGLAVVSGDPGTGKAELAAIWRGVAATRGFLSGSATVPGMPGDHPLVTDSAVDPRR